MRSSEHGRSVATASSSTCSSIKPRLPPHLMIKAQVHVSRCARVVRGEGRMANAAGGLVYLGGFVFPHRSSETVDRSTVSVTGSITTSLYTAPQFQYRHETRVNNILTQAHLLRARLGVRVRVRVNRVRIISRG